MRFRSASQQLTGTLQQLLLPLAHLDRVNGVIGGDLLQCLAATDRLHGDSGHELWAVGAACDQLLRRRIHLGREPPFSGSVPRLNVNDVSDQ